MNLRQLCTLALTALVITTSAPVAMANQQRAIESVESATQVFGVKARDSQNQIPESILEKAVAIAIIPNVVQAGFILGGTRGTGVLVARNAEGQWTNPAFVTLTGGSVGLQVGAQSSDVILVFNTKRSLERALAQDFNLGGSVSGTAGPVGANPVTGTSTVPDVYTYVRNRQGFFGGVSLAGMKLEMDNSRNEQFYEKPGVTALDIFTADLSAPEAAANLREKLDRYAPAPQK